MPDEAELLRLLDEDYATRAQVGIIKGMDADKDKAAESAAIEKNTGQDAQAVYGNFDEYVQRRKSILAQSLIEKDSTLQQYVNSHPMAANVSKDDWGALSSVSDLVKQYPWLAPTSGLGPYMPLAIAKALPDILDFAKSGLKSMSEAGQPGYGTVAETAKEALEKKAPPMLGIDPETWQKILEQQAKTGRGSPLDLIYGMGTIAMSPIAGLLRSEVTRPLEERLGEQYPLLKMEFTEPAVMLAITLLGLKSEIGKVTPRAYEIAKTNAILDRSLDTLNRIDPYLRNGERIPIGVDNSIDSLIGEDSQAKMKILDAIMDADKKTETKEISPEMYNLFTKLQHGDANLYLRWNAAKSLYGDKAPTADDGMLGWVPRIEEQMKSSALTGEPIEIPLADWRARVDPEINKLLHDDLFFEDGMTNNEAKELPKPGESTAVTIPEEQIPGLTQELDRPFMLNKVETGLFNITDETGNKTGQVKVAETDNGKTLIVHWEEGQDNAAGLRSLFNQLKEQYPNAENVTGPKTHGMTALESALQGAKVRTVIPFRIIEHPIDVAKRAAGLEPLGEAPVVRHTRDAESIQAQLPPPAEGFTRLWRGNRLEEVGKATRFTNSLPGIALPFREAYGGKLSYVDVPTADLPKYEQKVGAAPGAEFNVTPEIAAEAKVAPEPTKPLIEPLEAKGLTFEPGVLLPKRMYTKLQEAIDGVRNAIAERMFSDAKREEARRLTPEWRANYTKMREQVALEIGNRPDFRVSAFFRNGKWMGQDTHFMPKFDPKFLTPEQKKGFPKAWLKEGGMNPDEIAGSFGYSSGRDMVDKMIEFEQKKGDLQPRQFIDKMVDEETSRRMEQQYGKLGENVAKAAREHLIIKEQFDALHEEYLRLGQLAGQQLPLSKEDIRTNARTDFDSQISSKVSLMKYTRELGRSGRDTHGAYLKGDYLGAFKSRQEQLHIFEKARLAKDFERQQESLPRNLKRFSKGVAEGVKEVVSGVANPYTEMIQKIMYQIKRPPRRSIQNLDENIAKRDEKTLREFVNARNDIGLPEGALEFDIDHNQNLPVPDFLMDPLSDGTMWTKDLNATTVGEFKDIDNAIRALAKMGADEHKWVSAGKARDLSELKSKLINKLEELGVKKIYAPGEHPPIWQTINAKLVSMEFLMNKLGGGGDPRTNLFMQTFSFPFARAEGGFSADIRRVSSDMIAIGRKYGVKGSRMRERVDNDVFYNPGGMKKDADGKWFIPAGGKEWIVMTRANLRAVLLNMGNPSNLKWLAEGYRTTPEKIVAWANKYAAKEDWLYAKEVGDIFKDIQNDADHMTMEMSDTIIERLPLGKVQTQAAGELDGWYYPIVYDRALQGGKAEKIGPRPPVKPMTNASWQLQRTSPQGPLSLSIQPLASQISRRLRDNNFRQTVFETSKILLDKDFQAAVSRYQGPAYTKLFGRYLEDISGMGGLTSAAERSLESYMNHFLRNTIYTMIGLKVGTVLKHGLTAFFQSWAEAGIFAPDFYKSAAALWMTDSKTRNENWDFMFKGGQVGSLDWKGTTELQSRGRRINETIGGATEEQLGSMNMRDKFAYWASKPVAWSDMFSSTLLWHARYQKIMKEGMAKGLSIEEAHTQAVDLADYAVRRTHGSTSITSKPEAMRSKNAYVRSFMSLYGFFNHIYNRYYEMAWTAGAMRGKIQKGDETWKSDIRNLTSDFMFYAVVPAMIEEVVANWYLQSEKQEEEYTPWTFFKNGMIHTTAGTVPVLRDIINAVEMGHDPSIGILSGKYITDLVRDLDKESIEDIKPGDAVHHALNLWNITTGLGTPDQVNRWLGFLVDSLNDTVDPSTMTAEEWYRAARTGKPEKPTHR